jgi:hypothetical protein
MGRILDAHILMWLVFQFKNPGERIRGKAGNGSMFAGNTCLGQAKAHYSIFIG